jgi:hypothetical protein
VSLPGERAPVGGVVGGKAIGLAGVIRGVALVRGALGGEAPLVDGEGFDPQGEVLEGEPEVRADDEALVSQRGQ